MNLRNTSPYHTATLRKIFVVTTRAVRSGNREVDREWKPLIIFEEGRKRLRSVWLEGVKIPTLLVQTPKLTGDEFIDLFREQHGGPVQRFSNPADPKFGQPIGKHGALTSMEVAKIAQHEAQLAFRINIGVSLDAAVIRALQRAKVPQFVPLRVRKPVREKAPRNIVDERYQRVLELEAKWVKKIKLAQTKLKKLRVKRRHYERKFSKEQS